MKTFRLQNLRPWALSASLGAGLAQAYPVLDQAVPVGGEPIAVYQDHQNKNVYWYIPQSIEPWTRDARYKSSLFSTAQRLSFVFRGQASVDEAMLGRVAKALGTSPANLSPITYEYSRDLVCQNIFVEADQVSWQFPTMIGNYFEIVPVSIRTSNPDVVPELQYHIENGGLACTVSVGFKGIATGYKLKISGEFDRIYSKFEANAHAEGFWWEADVHHLTQRLIQEKVLVIESLEDTSMPQTELDKKTVAAMDRIVDLLTRELFTPALKLPEGELVGRGKPWSLRTDYRRSNERNSINASLISNKVETKNTQISLRLALQ